jgi:hypothetical protein
VKALILGLTVLVIAILAILPAGLGWGQDVLAFLRGALPVIAILIGVILVFTGVADIKDRSDAKKEEAQ